MGAGGDGGAGTTPGAGGSAGGGNGGNSTEAGAGGGGSGGGNGGTATDDGGGGGGGSSGGNGGSTVRDTNPPEGGGGGGGSGGGDGGLAADEGGGGGGGSGGGDGGNAFSNVGNILGDGGGGGGGGGAGNGGSARFGGGGGGGGGTGAAIEARINSDDTNLLAGTHIGYNWQLDRTVLGVEGDYSFNDDLDDYLASIRGRLGWADGNYLLYGTAGVAFAGRDGDDAVGVASGGGAGGDGGTGRGSVPSGGAGGNGGPGDGVTRFGDRDDDETGWVAGGGIEAMLSPMASVGFEALYYVFDGDNRDGYGIDDEFLALRGRLTTHLNGGAFAATPAANWAGFYMGGNIGALFNQNDKIADVQLANGNGGGRGGNSIEDGGGGGGGGGGGSAAFASFEDDASLIGGGHAGINWQSDQWVYGVEGDIGAVEDSYEYVASLRGRLGWAYDQVLLYATAGLAFAKNDGFNGTVVTGDGTGGNDGQDEAGDEVPEVGGAGGAGGVATVTSNGGGDGVDLGLVIGTGTDVKLSESLSLGMEGLWYFFDDGGEGAIINPATGGPVGGLDDDNQFLAVRARLTYHLGSHGPASMK